jgi:hypothetical protein
MPVGKLHVVKNGAAALLFMAALVLAACDKEAASAANAVVISKPDTTPRVLAVVVTTPEAVVGQNGIFALHAEAVTLNNAAAAVLWGPLIPYEGCIIEESTGKLTVTNAPEGEFTVRAVSAVDPSQGGEAHVRVVSGQPLVQSVEINPGMPRVPHGSTFPFTATVAGATANTGVTWEVSGGAEGGGTAFEEGTGILSVGENETSAVLWVTARSQADSRVCGQTVVLVPTVEEVTVTSGSATVAKGGQLQFYAAVSGYSLDAVEQAVIWTLEASANTVSSINMQSGLLMVGETETAQTLTARATSVYDSRKSATVAVTVSAAKAVLGHVEAVSPNGTTNKLTLFFDRDIPGLNENDIQITLKTAKAVTKGGLSKLAGATGVYELQVTGMTAGGTIGVTAAKDGITIQNAAQEVAVTRTVKFNGVTAVASNGLTAKLRLQFDADIAEIDTASVTLTGDATKGSGFTRTGTGVYEVPVTVSKYGTVKVKMAKTGIIFSPAEIGSVTVAGVSSANKTSPSIKVKFDITTTAQTGVTDTFNALHMYIQGGGLASSGNIINLGDYIDLEGGLSVAGYNSLGAFTASNSTISPSSAPFSGYNGKLLRLIVVGINLFHSNGTYTITANDSTSHVVFHFQNIPVTRRMEATPTNQNGYLGSEMRKYLVPTGDSGSGVFLTGLISAGVPDAVLWAPTRYVANKGNNNASGLHTITDKLWLPTALEMGNSYKSNLDLEKDANQARFGYYENKDSKRLKYVSGSSSKSYWEASPFQGEQKFCSINGSGSVSSASADSNSALGVAPAFCVK